MSAIISIYIMFSFPLVICWLFKNLHTERCPSDPRFYGVIICYFCLEKQKIVYRKQCPLPIFAVSRSLCIFWCLDICFREGGFCHKKTFAPSHSFGEGPSPKLSKTFFEGGWHKGILQFHSNMGGHVIYIR